MFLSKNNRFNQFLLVGRFSVSTYLRDQIIKKISKKINAIIPPIWCITDNIAMVKKLVEFI
jgi:tRNA A37 threonylcarbamoyltransferase TsaD